MCITLPRAIARGRFISGYLTVRQPLLKTSFREDGDSGPLRQLVEEMNCEEMLWAIHECARKDAFFPFTNAEGPSKEELDKFLLKDSVAKVRFKYPQDSTAVVAGIRQLMFVRDGRIAYRESRDKFAVMDRLEMLIISNYIANPKQKPRGGWPDKGTAWGGEWADKGGWGTQDQPPPKRHKHDFTDLYVWDGESPRRGDWGLALAVFRSCKQNCQLTDPEIKKIACPVGSSCRYRNNSCVLEHRQEKRAQPIAEILQPGKNILDMETLLSSA